MDSDWFQNKRVLDIGCHDGAMDLVLAARFAPKMLIGVDIDHKLSSKAMKNMHDCINNSECMSIIAKELQSNKNDKECDDEELKEQEEVISEYQSKINEILKRVKNLPKSMHMSIQGHVQSKTSDANLMSKLLSGQESQLPSSKDMKSYLYGKVSFRTENYISSI